MNGKLIVPESVILNLEFEYAKELCDVLTSIDKADEERDFLSYEEHHVLSVLKEVLEANVKTMKKVGE